MAGLVHTLGDRNGCRPAAPVLAHGCSACGNSRPTRAEDAAPSARPSDSGICECTKYDRPRGWSYVVGGPVAVEMDISLTPRREGTTLVTGFDARLKGLLALIFPVVLLMTRRAIKTNLLNAKLALEADGGSARIPR
jgi:hypothetical protein